jgi:pimeloyl-ACP methyl ester carboxylesterase
MKSIAVGATIRHYEEEGEGPAVILVHGSLSNARQWRKLGERLRDRFRVLAPDLYADAAADGAPKVGTFDFADDVAFVTRLIEASGGAAHLAGPSYGGAVAASAALACCEALASLILIEPSCFHLLEQEEEPQHAEIMALLARQDAHLARGDATAAARDFIAYWMGPKAWTEMPERRREVMTLGLPKLAHDWRGTLEHKTRLADYRAFPVRTLVLRARDTRAPSSRIVDLVCGALPNAELVEVDAGGHMSPLTNPEPVNDAIERFLGGKGAGGGA